MREVDDLKDILAERGSFQQSVQHFLLSTPKSPLHQFSCVSDRPFLPAVTFEDVFPNSQSCEELDSLFAAIDSFIDLHTEIVDSRTDKAGGRESDSQGGDSVMKKYDTSKIGKWITLYDGKKVIDDLPEEKIFYPSLPSLSRPTSSLFSFSSSQNSPAVLSFPTLEKMKQTLANDSLILSISSLEGFNFSSEFSLIYGGKFVSKRMYENSLAIIQKAISAADPHLSKETNQEYSTYLLDQIFWEFECKGILAAQYLRYRFPKITKLSFANNIDISHAQIFIGRDEITGELVSHIRFEDDIILMSEKSSKPEADNLMKLISYHTIRFREELIQDFQSQKDQILKKQEQLMTKRKGSRSKTLDSLLLELLSQSLSRSRFYLVNSALLVNYEKDAEVRREDSVLDPLLLDAKAPRLLVSEASFCSEVIVWGHNTYFSMGLGDRKRRRHHPRKLSSKVGPDRDESEDENEPQSNKPSLEDELYDPRPLPLSRNITIERVKMIACSARHTLLLTHFSSLYATGDNTEGALGLGDTIPRSTFTLVDYLSEGLSGSPSISSSIRSKITFIAVGSGALGSHSMAIDQEGTLYGWGFPKASGTGSTQPVNRPRKVTIPRLSSSDEMEGSSEEKIRMVACGDAFTVCLTTTGLVYTWGQWSHGRLGLGPIPTLKNAGRRSLASRFSDQGNKKLAKYQLKPTRVLDLENVIHVACGEAHTLALLADNSVLAWGQNTLGQLGTGPTRSGLLKDAFIPVLVAPFISEVYRRNAANRVTSRRFLMKEANPVYYDFIHSIDDSVGSEAVKKSVVVKNIYCGAFHSLCIDVEGDCWSWGSRGSPCLGHSDTVLLGDWSNKISALFSLSTTDSERMVPYELWPWCLTWSMPRKIVALEGHDIIHIAAGDLHSIFLSSMGRIFLAGSGPVVPPFSPPNRITEEEEDGGRKEPEGGSEPKTADLSIHKVLGDVVSSPRSPSASWMKELCTRHIHYISSSGSRVFMIIDEELISSRLTNHLYRKLLSSRRDHDEEDGDGDDLLTVDSRYSDFTSSQFGSILEARGKADCMVIASGHVFLCHKALLALRSPELRNMIIMEAPIEIEGGGGAEDGSSSTGLVQLLLPELNRDAARALFFFLYRDTLPLWAIGSLPTLTALSRVGKTLRIPRLFLLCERFIDILTFNSSVRDSDVGGDDKDGIFTTSDEKLVEELPPPTLVRDLGSLLGDPEFADVRFIAESRAVAAHRFILEGRCEYFRAMFRSGMAEGSVAGRHVIDVVVPDSFVGFLRLLIFIYTSTLPDGSDGALLEDLMAADRYGIAEMKEVVESMLKPSQFNWMDLLRAAELLHLPKLRATVLCFLRDNFGVLQFDRLARQYDDLYLEDDSEEDEAMGTPANKKAISAKDSRHSSQNSGRRKQQVLFQQLREEFPSLLEEILVLRSAYSPTAPSQLLIEEGKLTKESTMTDEENHPFPFWALALAAVSLVAYQYATQILPIGPIVPIVNIGGFFFLIFYGFRILSK